jgi:hypothetical protein
VLQAVLCLSTHGQRIIKQRIIKERAIKRRIVKQRAIKECAIKQLHIELFCKSRATEPRIIESFATERPTMSFFEPYLKSWAISMCATLFTSELRSNPCAKLDINLLYIELCIVMRIVVSLRYQEWS